MNDTNLTRQEKIDAMRRVLDFLAENPKFPVPASMGHLDIYIPSWNDGKGKQELAACARMLGTFEKAPDESYFKIRRDFGGASIEVRIDRSAVCEKKTVTKTVTVDEWQCPDSLLEFDAAVGEGQRAA